MPESGRNCPRHRPGLHFRDTDLHDSAAGGASGGLGVGGRLSHDIAAGRAAGGLVAGGWLGHDSAAGGAAGGLGAGVLG